MTERQLKQLRNRMIERISDLYNSVHRGVTEVQLREAFQQDDTPRDEGDESLQHQIRDLRYSLAETDARLAQAIEGALARIAAGTYGKCIDCGNEIETARLNAVPWAPRCIDCQEAVENELRERPPTF